MVKITNPYKQDKSNDIVFVHMVHLDEVSPSDIETDDLGFADFTTTYEKLVEKKMHRFIEIELIHPCINTRDYFDVIRAKRENANHSEIWLGYWNDGTHTEIY